MTFLGLWSTWSAWPGPATPDFWIWFAMCLAGELLWVRLPVGQATVSMASCFQFAALLLLPRGHAMALAGLSTVLAESTVMRKAPLRSVYNGAQAALSVGAAGLALAAFEGAKNVTDMVYGFQPLPLLAAALLYFAINTGTVSLAVSVSERISPWRAWRTNFGNRYELLSNGTLFSLGALLASHYATNGVKGTLLVVFPILVAHESYRRYHRAADAAAAAAANASNAAHAPTPSAPATPEPSSTSPPNRDVA
jgi:hypothetical protein